MRDVADLSGDRVSVLRAERFFEVVGLCHFSFRDVHEDVGDLQDLVQIFFPEMMHLFSVQMGSGEDYKF